MYSWELLTWKAHLYTNVSIWKAIVGMWVVKRNMSMLWPLYYFEMWRPVPNRALSALIYLQQGGVRWAIKLNEPFLIIFVCHWMNSSLKRHISVSCLEREFVTKWQKSTATLQNMWHIDWSVIMNKKKFSDFLLVRSQNELILTVRNGV